MQGPLLRRRQAKLGASFAEPQFAWERAGESCPPWRRGYIVLGAKQAGKSELWQTVVPACKAYTIVPKPKKITSVQPQDRPLVHLCKQAILGLVMSPLH